jgi:phosphoribosyl 1,2-cyclic phosphate phosphodiesterase
MEGLWAKVNRQPHGIPHRGDRRKDPVLSAKLAGARLPPVASFSFTFLGTGTSVGVPVIGCDCVVCQSPDPRNKRTRASVMLQAGDLSLLVDTGPDLREQALRENIRKVDAVLYTHAHLDHVVGFDELRAFCWRREAPLPMHATPECMLSIRSMFGWAFADTNVIRGYVKPAPEIISGPFRYGDLAITPLPVVHANVETIGYLFDFPGFPSIAYLPDVKEVPEATLASMRGVDLLVVDALRPGGHPTHFSTGDALDLAEVTGAGETLLTHLGHENDHAELEARLPAGVGVAWDGLRLEWD